MTDDTKAPTIDDVRAQYDAYLRELENMQAAIIKINVPLGVIEMIKEIAGRTGHEFGDVLSVLLIHQVIGEHEEIKSILETDALTKHFEGLWKCAKHL